MGLYFRNEIKNMLYDISIKEKRILSLYVVSCMTYMISADSLYGLFSIIGIYIVFCLVPIVALFGQEMIEKNDQNILWGYISACFVFFVYVALHDFEIPLVSTIGYCIFTGCFIALKHRYREWIFIKFVRVNAILLIAGMIEYIFALLGINFFWGAYERFGVTFYQGLFMSIPSYIGYSSVRFMGLYDEPGHLGTLSFFILITLDYSKYKKEYIVYLIAGLISFSLAFYVLYSAWMLTRNIGDIKKVKRLIPIAGIVLLLSIPFGSYFEERIIDRVNNKDDISDVDNRTSDEVDRKFEKYIVSSDAVFGLGERNFYEWKKQTGNTCAGLKSVLFMEGIVGFTLMFLIFNLLFLRYNGYNRLSYKKLVFYWINFYQHAFWLYPPLVVLFFKEEKK